MITKRILFDDYTRLSLYITNYKSGKGKYITWYSLFVIIIIFIYLLRNIVKGRFNCERCFIFIVLLNLFLNIFMIYGPVKLGGSGLRAGFKTFEIIDKELADNPAVHINDSDSFYRVDVMSSTRGESMILDYYGTAEYFSMINKNIYDFYDEMMISPGKGIFSWVLKNLDGRMILNSLLSAKYIEGFQEDSIYNRVAYRNINSLPLGYVYSDYIEKDFFMTLNPLERQEIMLHSVVLEQKIETMGQKSREQNCSELQPFFYRPITYNIDYINIEKNAEEIQVNSTSEILINTADVEEGENYIFLEGFKRNFNTSDAVKLIIGNKEVELTGKGIDDLMINIGTSNIASLRFSREGTYSIDKICMYHLSEKDIKRPIEKLRQNSLQNIKISGNTVSGEINSKIDGLLFLSIPYGTGWEAYVDGVKTNIYKANIGFMAIPLKQGEHVIVLHYTTPGIWVGGILALVGWFLWEL